MGAAEKIVKKAELDWSGWVQVRSVQSERPLPIVLEKGIVVGKRIGGIGTIEGLIARIDLHVQSGAARITVKTRDGGERYAMLYPGAILFEVSE